MNLGVVSVQFPLDSPLDDIGALASPCLNEISEALSRDGFLALNAITDADEVVDIRATLSGFFAKQVGAKEGSMFDTLASKPGEQSGRSIQLTNPTEYAPELLRTQFVRNATKIASLVSSERPARSTRWRVRRRSLSGAPSVNAGSMTASPAMNTVTASTSSTRAKNTQ